MPRIVTKNHYNKKYFSGLYLYKDSLSLYRGSYLANTDIYPLFHSFQFSWNENKKYDDEFYRTTIFSNHWVEPIKNFFNKKTKHIFHCGEYNRNKTMYNNSFTSFNLIY